MQLHIQDDYRLHSHQSAKSTQTPVEKTGLYTRCGVKTMSLRQTATMQQRFAVLMLFPDLVHGIVTARCAKSLAQR